MIRFASSFQETTHTSQVFLSNNLEIVDVSNPSVPVHAGSISNGGDVKLNYPQSVFVAGNYAYVASSFSNALEIVDVSNPATPVHAGSISHGGDVKLYYSAERLRSRKLRLRCKLW